MNTSFNSHSGIRFNFTIFIYIIRVIDTYINIFNSYFETIFFDSKKENLKGDLLC